MKNIDKNFKVMGIFLDVQLAFDCVNYYEILLRKLENSGIRGVPNSLFRSFLSGRTQSVKYDDFSSESLNVSRGVPQSTRHCIRSLVVYYFYKLSIKNKN